MRARSHSSGTADVPTGEAATRGLGLWIAYLGFLLAIVLVAYPDLLRIQFINEDYIFLDDALNLTFLQNWSREHDHFGWYRPWSRESHFWFLARALGSSAPAAHAASLVLWLGILLVFRSLACRALGIGRGTLAAASLALLSSWSVPLLWCAGVQESWLLLFALLAIRSTMLAAPLWKRLPWVLLALASKETAVILPVVLAILERVALRIPLRKAALHFLACGTLVLCWFLFHPGTRQWGGEGPPRDAGVVAGDIVRNYGQSVMALLNLERWPAPEDTGPALFIRAFALALAIVVLLWMAHRTQRHPGSTRSAAELRPWILGGALWAASAWLPPALLGHGWHAYYGLLGAMGAALSLAAWTPASRVVALAVSVWLGVLLLLQAQTPSVDWSSPRYLRRASAFQAIARTSLMALRPQVPSHARLYFLNVPNNVGFLSGTGPALRFWYGDRTLSGAFLSDYELREPSRPSGPDLFFRYDSLGHWVEISPGPENFEAARKLNPRWQRDHEALAAAFARAGDPAAAAHEYFKLVHANPESADLAFNLGVCLYGAGDTLAAWRWISRAARMPTSTEEIREGARMLESELNSASR